MEEKKNIRTHRVGTITFGCILVLFGVLFLLHIVLPKLKYEFIFRLWPCIFLFLGGEVLLSNCKTEKGEREGKQIRFLYDKTAILLTVLLTFFAMVMAAVDLGLQYGTMYITF